jgi:hypothetical protein
MDADLVKTLIQEHKDSGGEHRKANQRFIDAQGKAVGGELSDGEPHATACIHPVFVAVNKA